MLTTVASSPQLQDDRDRVDARRKGCLQRLFDIYMAMGKLGTLWDDEELSKTERYTVFANALTNVSTTKLGAMLRIGARLDIYLHSRADHDTHTHTHTHTPNTGGSCSPPRSSRATSRRDRWEGRQRPVRCWQA